MSSSRIETMLRSMKLNAYVTASTANAYQA